MRQLEKEYEEFVQKKDNNFDFKISFLKKSKNLLDVFEISEGTSGLASLMRIYAKHMKPFKGQGKKYPVIILVDDDDGFKGIKKQLNNFKPTRPFTYFAENLYVVLVSRESGDEKVAIEDLFDKKTLDIENNGKRFNLKNKTDTSIEYGKNTFAEKVVKANQKTINFDGFKEILDRFKKVIEDYYDKK